MINNLMKCMHSIKIYLTTVGKSSAEKICMIENEAAIPNLPMTADTVDSDLLKPPTNIITFVKKSLVYAKIV